MRFPWVALTTAPGIGWPSDLTTPLWHKPRAAQQTPAMRRSLTVRMTNLRGPACEATLLFCQRHFTLAARGIHRQFHGAAGNRARILNGHRISIKFAGYFERDVIAVDLAVGDFARRTASALHSTGERGAV